MENYFALLPMEATVLLIWWQHDMPTRNTVSGGTLCTEFSLR